MNQKFLTTKINAGLKARVRVDSDLPRGVGLSQGILLEDGHQPEVLSF